MIRVVRRGKWNGRVCEVVDRGEFLLGLTADSNYAMVATPDDVCPGTYKIEKAGLYEIRLRLRTPIPLFDASHMGRPDAAKPAASAASTPTEELTNADPIDPAACGG